MTDTASADAAQIWTIKRVLDWTRGYLERRGSTSARLDAELLLAATLAVPRLNLYLAFDQPLAADELARVRALIQRRARAEPVAYILGKRDFHAIELAVSPAVLIPRPETERLVDLAVAFLAAPETPAGDILDLCTGSGAVALAIAAACAAHPTERAILATDTSTEALAVAQRNRDQLGLAGVQFARGDLFDAVAAGRKFAAIVCNPPYVRTEDWCRLDADVRRYEPRLALDGGTDGLDLVRRIAVASRGFLVEGGLLALEVGSRAQAQATCRILADRGFEPTDFEMLGPGPTCIVEARAAVV